MREVHKVLGVPGDDFEEIRQMMLQEQAEGALRDCIEIYRQEAMKDAMMLMGYYKAYMTVGFTPEQALILTMKCIK